MMTSTLSLSASNSAAVSANAVFTLNSLNLDSAFQSVFDSYRIDCVRVTVKPSNNALGLVANATTSLVDFYNVIDYNNSVGASTVNAFTKYENCMILPPAEGCTRTFQPRPSVMVSSIAGTGYMPTTPGWLSTANDDIIHYGWRYLIPQASAGQLYLQTWDVTFEYWISFKSVV